MVHIYSVMTRAVDERVLSTSSSFDGDEDESTINQLNSFTTASERSWTINYSAGWKVVEQHGEALM